MSAGKNRRGIKDLRARRTAREFEDNGDIESQVVAATQRAVGTIDAVALVTARHQGGASGDGIGVGVQATTMTTQNL
jgi:hypothetical protein